MKALLDLPIEPDLDFAAAGGAGYSSLESRSAAAKTDIVVNDIISIFNIPDILPAFSAAFSLNARLAVEIETFYERKVIYSETFHLSR